MSSRPCSRSRKVRKRGGARLAPCGRAEGWSAQETAAGEKGRDHRASQCKDFGFGPIELRPRRCAASTEARRPWPPEPALTRPAVARLARSHSPRAARRPPLGPWCCLARCRPSRRPARTRPSAPGSCAALRRAARPPGSPGPTGAPAPPCRSAARPLPPPGELRFPAAPTPTSGLTVLDVPQHTTSDLREAYGFRRAGSPLRPQSYGSGLRYCSHVGPWGNTWAVLAGRAVLGELFRGRLGWRPAGGRIPRPRPFVAGRWGPRRACARLALACGFRLASPGVSRAGVSAAASPSAVVKTHAPKLGPPLSSRFRLQMRVTLYYTHTWSRSFQSSCNVLSHIGLVLLSAPPPH